MALKCVLQRCRQSAGGHQLSHIPHRLVALGCFFFKQNKIGLRKREKELIPGEMKRNMADLRPKLMHVVIFHWG